MFASGSSKVAASHESLLRQVAEQYLRSGGTIAVIGHASQTVADRADVRRQIANFSVSLDRATAVAQALQRYGVPGEAIAISAQIDGVALNDAQGRRADVFLR
jgi:outer membrane protein OmpA-like peptidoglycan-associated protein